MNLLLPLIYSKLVVYATKVLLFNLYMKIQNEAGQAPSGYLYLPRNNLLPLCVPSDIYPDSESHKTYCMVCYQEGHFSLEPFISTGMKS